MKIIKRAEITEKNIVCSVCTSEISYNTYDIKDMSYADGCLIVKQKGFLCPVCQSDIILQWWIF